MICLGASGHTQKGAHRQIVIVYEIIFVHFILFMEAVSFFLFFLQIRSYCQLELELELVISKLEDLNALWARGLRCDGGRGQSMLAVSFIYLYLRIFGSIQHFVCLDVLSLNSD